MDLKDCNENDIKYIHSIFNGYKDSDIKCFIANDIYIKYNLENFNIFNNIKNIGDLEINSIISFSSSIDNFISIDEIKDKNKLPKKITYIDLNKLPKKIEFRLLFNADKNISNSQSQNIYYEEAKDKVFVFGDNMESWGTGGQACIRYYKNSFGIPTKRAPKTSKDSYFSDKLDEENEVMKKLRELYKLNKDSTIVFPINNDFSISLGGGLAKMQELSPNIYKKMIQVINEHFLNNSIISIPFSNDNLLNINNKENNFEIYTNYYSSKKRIDSSFEVSISQYPPKWFVPKGNGDNGVELLKEFAPSKELLMDYKNGLEDDIGYTTRFLKEMEKKDINKLMNDVIKKAQDKGLTSISLNCFEIPTDFCHRHIIANILKDKGYSVIGEVSNIYSKEKNEELENKTKKKNKKTGVK
jgi:uncharacterized protein YeaO (DUF488 family)